MKKKNFKDIVANICGIVFTVSGSIIAASSMGVAIPAVVLTYAIVGGTVSGGIISWLTGKNPDLSKKTPGQIDNQLTPKP